MAWSNQVTRIGQLTDVTCSPIRQARTVAGPRTSDQSKSKEAVAQLKKEAPLVLVGQESSTPAELYKTPPEAFSDDERSVLELLRTH
jgi:hypothetical protein